MSTSTEDILIAALQEIGVMGADQTALEPEDTPIVLRRFNQILGQRNARPGLAKFIRSQSWTFSVARDSYTIGASGDSPNFAVTAGGPPVEIESAFIVNTDQSPNTRTWIPTWTKQQYDNQISSPTSASTSPVGIYYQASFPLGVIFPWPANPTKTAYKLEVNWPDQLLEVALVDIATVVRLAPGLERDLTLQLALALCIPFEKTPSRELKEQASQAATDFASRNRKPPTIDTSGGMNRPWNFDPRSYRPT
jgi:hypothetical protein